MINMTRLVVAASGACLALAIGSAVAVAHTATYPTFINTGGAGQANQPGFFAFDTHGDLDTDRPGCLGGRTIKFFFVEADGQRTLKDVDRSSNNGYWAVGGSAGEPPDRFLIKVTRKRLDSGGSHKHFCGGNESVTYPR